VVFVPRKRDRERGRERERADAGTIVRVELTRVNSPNRLLTLVVKSSREDSAGKKRLVTRERSSALSDRSVPSRRARARRGVRRYVALNRSLNRSRRRNGPKIDTPRYTLAPVSIANYSLLIRAGGAHQDVHSCVGAAIIHLELIANLLPVNSVCTIKP